MDGFWAAEFGLRIVALVRKTYVGSAEIREMAHGGQGDSNTSPKRKRVVSQPSITKS